jgi:hypothetical protein
MENIKEKNIAPTNREAPVTVLERPTTLIVIGGPGSTPAGWH